MGYLWSRRQERFYVDVGVVHLQVMVPQPPGHSDSCHYSCLGVEAESHEKHTHRKHTHHCVAAAG